MSAPTPDEIAAAKERLQASTFCGCEADNGTCGQDHLCQRCQDIRMLFAALERAEKERDDEHRMAVSARSDAYDANEACKEFRDELERAEAEQRRLLDALSGTVAQVEQQRKRAEQAETKLAESERRAAKLDELFSREDSKRAAAERRVEVINREHSETMNVVLAERAALEQRFHEIKAFLGDASPKSKQAYERMAAERDALLAEVCELRQAVSELLDHVETQNCDVIGAIEGARAALAIRQQEEPKP